MTPVSGAHLIAERSLYGATIWPVRPDPLLRPTDLIELSWLNGVRAVEFTCHTKFIAEVPLLCKRSAPCFWLLCTSLHSRSGDNLRTPVEHERRYRSDCHL